MCHLAPIRFAAVLLFGGLCAAPGTAVAGVPVAGCSAPNDMAREVHGAAADFRLALGVRISGPGSSSVRAFAGADFEGSPARLHSARIIDRALPHLPWWSTGLALGVLWGPR